MAFGKKIGKRSTGFSYFGKKVETQQIRFDKDVFFEKNKSIGIDGALTTTSFNFEGKAITEFQGRKINNITDDNVAVPVTNLINSGILTITPTADRVKALPSFTGGSSWNEYLIETFSAFDFVLLNQSNSFSLTLTVNGVDLNNFGSLIVGPSTSGIFRVIRLGDSEAVVVRLGNDSGLQSTAAQAVSLTSGDKTIQGNLRIGGDSDTSNNWISIDARSGGDNNGGGITFYETGSYSVNIPQYGAKIVYNETDDELAIGTMHDNTFMRQIHMDRNSSAVNLTNLVVQNDDANGPYTYYKNLDTSITDGQNLARTLVYTADRDAAISRINWVATEDHDSDSGGCKIDFIITPNGNSQSETTAMTINQDSSLTVNGNIELGHASDTTIARSAAGKVTIEGAPVQTTQMVVTHHHFFMNSTSTSADFFFPYNNLNEASSTSQYYTRTIAPYDGKIVKVLVRPSAGIGTSCEVQFHKITDTSTDFGTLVERVHSLNLNTAETTVTATFSSATFSAGDVVNVSLIKSDSATANIQAVIVWEYTV